MAALMVAVVIVAIVLGRLVLRITRSLFGWIIAALVGVFAIGGIVIVVQGWIDAGGIPLK